MLVWALYLVINVTICKHGVEILHTFTGTPVIVMFQALLDRPHVHGVFYYFVIILLEKQDITPPDMQSVVHTSL